MKIKSSESREAVEFQKRLTTALNNSSHVPAPGKGRQTTLAREVGVSQEAVRNWLNGKARPRPDMMSRLAELLEVDNSWLALGQSPSGGKYSAAKPRTDLAGAVHYVFGLMCLMGRPPAFSDAPGTDLAAVKDNRLVYYTVVLGQMHGTTQCIAEIPADVSPTATIVIPVADVKAERVPLVITSKEEVETLSEFRDGFFTLNLSVTRKASSAVFTSGERVLTTSYLI